MNAKIIFLDFDGVLNNMQTKTRNPRGFRGLDAENIAQLNRLVLETGAEIFISSTWRREWNISELREQLIAAGFQHPSALVGFTPILGGGEHRRTEIGVIVEREAIQHFVVLDDTNYANNMTDFGHRFIQTDDRTGLTEAHVETAIRILNNPVLTETV